MNRLRLTVYLILIDSSECQWRHGGDYWTRLIVAQLCALLIFVYKMTLLFLDNDNRINRKLGPCLCTLSILGSSSKGIHDSAEPRHVYFPTTCLIYWSVQRQGRDLIFSITFCSSFACHVKVEISPEIRGGESKYFRWESSCKENDPQPSRRHIDFGACATFCLAVDNG